MVHLVGGLGRAGADARRAHASALPMAPLPGHGDKREGGHAGPKVGLRHKMAHLPLARKELCSEEIHLDPCHKALWFTTLTF